MNRLICASLTLTALTVGVTTALGQVTLLEQARVISATTSADNRTVIAQAADFSPFVQTVTASTTFPGPNGTPETNAAATGIECVVDPNAVRATGNLTATGGLNIHGQAVSGEAAANIFVRFQVPVPTPYHLHVTPRPSNSPRDRFRIEVENAITDQRIFRLREDQAAQTVDTSGVLPAGEYIVEFEVEYTVAGPSATRDFDFQMQLGNRCGTADFNADGDSGTDRDIEAFFACLAGNCCATCSSADFNADGDNGTDADIESFFRVLAGGAC